MTVWNVDHILMKGVAGILDISPFSCMNGMVSEAIYPKLSRDHGNLPIRTLYFDGSRAADEQELVLFKVLSRG